LHHQGHKDPRKGSAQNINAARRLAAILAADVVGYSRLMGEDEADTAKIVRERREASAPIVRSLGGRLVKTMGDGVLLEFPSVVAAVECAILIQKMMAERNAELPEGKRILYRVGVHLGDALTGFYRDDARRGRPDEIGDGGGGIGVGHDGARFRAYMSLGKRTVILARSAGWVRSLPSGRECSRP
jgi:class 3 adenylate cyclase